MLAKERHSKLCTTLCTTLIYKVCSLNLSKPAAAEVKHVALEAFAVSYISNSFYFFLPHPSLCFAVPDRV